MIFYLHFIQHLILERFFTLCNRHCVIVLIPLALTRSFSIYNFVHSYFRQKWQKLNEGAGFRAKKQLIDVKCKDAVRKMLDHLRAFKAMDR